MAMIAMLVLALIQPLAIAARASSDLYAYADSYNPGVAAGAVAESNQTNNQFHLGGLTVVGKNPAQLSRHAVADLRLRPVRLR